MPPRYKDVDECRSEIQQYIGQLESGTDDTDPELRKSGSTVRYKQDLRWYDHWLDQNDIESVLDVTPAASNQLGQDLSTDFNGTTPRYRWDRIYSFYEWLLSMGLLEDNPLGRWNDKKGELFGLTKSTEQSKQLGEDETYAVSESEVRQMEEHVGRNRVRDQLIIRLLWQTGMRRGELSQLTLDDMDRDSREITIRAVVAKNDQKRVLAYQRTAEGLLSEWLNRGYRDEMAATASHNRLLVGERGGPLSPGRINDIVIDAANKAGFNRKLYPDANAATDENGDKIENRWLISAHNVRHGYGTYMIHETDAGLWEVSKQMGHSSVKITEETYVDPDPRAGLEHAHQYGPD
ncbi:recombinase XerD [Halobacteriales archaeon QH_7_65_31]|nr:MAG: recombinase XerD [Halobacteriales archaeon QH_7_65_31]